MKDQSQKRYGECLSVRVFTDGRSLENYRLTQTPVLSPPYLRHSVTPSLSPSKTRRCFTSDKADFLDSFDIPATTNTDRKLFPTLSILAFLISRRITISHNIIGRVTLSLHWWLSGCLVSHSTTIYLQPSAGYLINHLTKNWLYFLNHYVIFLWHT